MKRYKKFRAVLMDFRAHFGPEQFGLKEADKYLRQRGKDYFPKTYG